jgi:hypothetical protein
MAAIPVVFGHPIVSLLSTMCFPSDLGKARRCAGFIVAHAGEGALARLEPRTLAKVTGDAASFAPLHGEWDEAREAGNVVGHVTHALWRLHQDHPGEAGFERAVRTVGKAAGLGRGRVWERIRRFREVAHFWGCWVDVRGELPSDGLELAEFLAKAENILATVDQYRDAVDAYRMLPGLNGPVYPNFDLPRDLLVARKNPGRPRKAPA